MCITFEDTDYIVIIHTWNVTCNRWLMVPVHGTAGVISYSEYNTGVLKK